MGLMQEPYAEFDRPEAGLWRSYRVFLDLATMRAFTCLSLVRCVLEVRAGKEWPSGASEGGAADAQGPVAKQVV